MYERYSSSSGRRPTPSIQRAFIYSNAVAQVLVFISSGCNPIVYGICNKNYREFYMYYRLLGGLTPVEGLIFCYCASFLPGSLSRSSLERTPAKSLSEVWL